MTWFFRLLRLFQFVLCRLGSEPCFRCCEISLICFGCVHQVVSWFKSLGSLWFVCSSLGCFRLCLAVSSLVVSVSSCIFGRFLCLWFVCCCFYDFSGGLEFFSCFFGELRCSTLFQIVLRCFTMWFLL